MKLLLSTLILVSSVFSNFAHADQCAVVTGDQAFGAIQALSSRAAYHYCADCGDRQARALLLQSASVKVFDIKTNALIVAIALSDFSGNSLFIGGAIVTQSYRYEVVVNDGGSEKVIDLAYAYDQLGNNIGAAAGCSNDSPTSLTLEQMAGAILNIGQP